MKNERSEVGALLNIWADRTRRGLQDEILRNHDQDAVIFDVLPPMQYEGIKAYRESWDDWQPQTTGENVFEFTNLQIVESDEVAFAFGHIRCGGTSLDGNSFEDNVRATFCLHKTNEGWRISHQHISMPRSSS